MLASLRNGLRALTLGRFVVLFTFIAVFVMAVRAPLDTDTLWHLRAGEWQVQNQSLLRVDLFSHTRAGEAWINHSWVSQFIIYGFYSALGDAGLALYTATLATAGMYFVYRQLEGDVLVRALAVLLASAAAAVFWSARPQMMSFFLSCVMLYLLWLYQKRRVNRLWLIPLIFLFWANVHGGFAIGFILLVLATIGEALNWFFAFAFPQPDASTRPSLLPIRNLILTGLASAAVISINPYGPRMLFYPFRTVGIGVLRDYIQEWAAPNFHQAQTWPFIWMLLGLIVLIGVSRRGLDWRDAVMVTGTAYSALLAGRNIAVFAIVAAPVIAAHAAIWLDSLGYRIQWNRPPRTALIALGNWLLLVGIIAAGIVKIAYALDPQITQTERERTLPVAAVEYLEQNPLPGPIFNSYNWGGYLIWTARDYPVYVDGRTDLYDDEILRGFLNTYLGQEGWEQNLETAGINLVLVESSSPLARLLALDDAWRAAYTDGVASLYARRQPLGE